MPELIQPIRVLHMVGKLGSGGVEKLLVSVLENINRDEITFDFLLSSEEKGFYDEYVQELGAKLICIPSGNEIIEKIKRRFKVYKFLKKGKYSIVHLHGTQPQTYADAYLAKKAGVENVILHAHNTQSMTKFRVKVLPLFKSIFGKYPTYYLACSQEAADYMWPKDVDSDKCSVVINGIDFSEYTFSLKKRKIFRQENHLEDKFVVGNIGRFAEQKNQSFLIDIFYQIQKRIPKSALLLIGEGKLEAQIKMKVKELGIENKVIFFGTTKDVPSALMGMDVMCFPSLYEGLGIVAVEAQAASLDVVVSDGVPDSANISPFYHKLNLTDSANAWADKVCSFLNSSYRKSNMQCLGQSSYDIRETANKLMQIYRNLEEEG